MDKENEFGSLLKMIEETSDQIRDLSHDLVVDKMEADHFISTIESYVNEANKISDKRIQFYPHPKKALNETDDLVKTEVFKIIQELLSNAIKHSKAEAITIYLNKYDASLNLIFEDDGVGFNVDKTASGIGINNIKNRIKALSGTMHIDSNLNKGAIFTVDIPLSKKQHYEEEFNYSR